MCLLTLTHPDARPDYERLYTASLHNPDGFGFAVHADDHIVIGRGMDIDCVLDEYMKAVTLYPDGPSMFHLRLATHGGVNTSNCHPFWVDAQHMTCMAHNGILPIDVPRYESRSDTRIFAEDVFPHIGIAALNSHKMRKKLRKYTGSYNKLAFITVDPESHVTYRIIGEDLGHWREGVWYSNDSYKYTPRLYKFGGLGSRAMAWRFEDEEEESTPVSDAAYGIRDDVCAVCNSIMDDEQLNVFGYCNTCESCVMCHEHFDYCLCWQGTDLNVPDEPAVTGGES